MCTLITITNIPPHNIFKKIIYITIHCKNIWDTTVCLLTECQIYKRRWLMLILFVFYSMSNAMQWVQYSIIENVVTRYYGLEPTSSWIEWTSMIYMLTYIFFILPGSWALDKFVCFYLFYFIFRHIINV